jgi:uncharacterized protein (DUF2236 family)
METKRFVADDSIILKIWGTTDITLFIFAGAAAEFALNKQVDWLYFTGKLPADPIGRLFSTVDYAQQIIFQMEKKANDSISKINSIHHGVEQSRGRSIPAEAYKDVLFMLIHYSISAYELLERKLTIAEKDEVVVTFRRIAERMHMADLPVDYAAWQLQYSKNLQSNLEYSAFTKDLFTQYRRHLGLLRYFIVVEVQKKLVPAEVKKMLGYHHSFFVTAVIPFYRLIRKFPIHIRAILLLVPARFKEKVWNMDRRRWQLKTV